MTGEVGSDTATTTGADEHGPAHVVGPALDAHAATWPADYATIQARRVPDRPALIFKEWTTSYAELDRASSAFAAILAQSGIGAGQRIAYLGRNNDLFLPVLFGSMRAGVVVIPINWRNTAAEIRYVLEDGGAHLILVEQEFAATAAEAAGQKELPRIIVDDPGEAGLRARLRATAPAARRPVDPDAPCLQLYTSGTTGRPKGVLVTQRLIGLSRATELQMAAFADWRDDEVQLAAMPLFHIGGISWALTGLLRGQTCVITAELTAPNLVDLFIRHHVTRTWIVPTVVRMVLEEVRARGVSLKTLRSIYYGAAPMDLALLRDGMNELGCRFLQYYGMTEITGSATVLWPEHHDPARPHLLRSVGKPVPGYELQIRGPDKRVLRVGEAGEIWVKGPTIMIGYWNKPEATAEAVEDGWYRTGDGGRVDAEGFLYLTDRIKDMIVSGGENVYPVEVEAVLREHPAVAEVAVFGIPDERWGERVVAAVELRPGRKVEPDALIEHARRSLAGYKIPRIIELDLVLPRTASGKVQRGVAKKMYLDKRSRSPGTPA